MLEIGETLREARRQRGLELVDAEAATRIRSRYLEALEWERFDLLPLGSYRCSFLREYAEFLGLDGNVFAAEYDLRFPAPKPEPAPPRYRQTLGLARIPQTRTILILGSLALIGIAVWQLGGSPHVKTPPSHLTTRAVATHPAPVRTAPLPHKPRSRVKPKTGPPVLVLTAASGSCWLLVRVKSEGGRTIYERTL